MVITLGIISIKGGVGKTTISAALASSLANDYKKKTLLIDANYSAPNLGLHMDIIQPEKTLHQAIDGKARIESAIHNRYGVDVIPGSYVYDKLINPLRLKDKLQRIKNNYDFIIIDSSPSLNEESLSTILASDYLFLVTTPDYPTLSCSLKIAHIAKQRGKNVKGIIINKIRDPLYELTLKEIERTSEIPVIARIKDDKNLSRSLFTRIPMTIYKKRSRFSREIDRLSATLANKKEKAYLIKKFLSLNFRKEEVNRQLLKESFYRGIFAK
ncbi:MAG: AAA family ATPase [Nanoarchaeota archaeon]